MNKFYAFSGIAAMAIALTVVSCSSDDDLYVPTDAEIQAHATEQLGVAIDPNQDWNMTAKATAGITIHGDYGEKYTVKIYSNDPVLDRKGYVLTKGTIDNGGTFQKDFEYPSVEKRLVVGITNSHGYTNYRTVPVVNGQLNAVFGNANVSQARGPRKSMESPSVPNITVTAEYAASFLEGAKEPTDANVVDDYDNSQYVEGKASEWIVTKEKQWVEGKYVQGEEWGFNWAGNGSTLWYNDGNIDQVWFKDQHPEISSEDIEWYKTNVRPYKNSNWAFYNTDNSIAAFAVLLEYLNQTGRSGWVSIYKQGVLPHQEEGYWTEEEGYWTQGVEEQWIPDETYVKKFKITGTWDKNINVLPSAGRSVYVSGTWNIPNGNDQWNYNTAQANAGSVIIVADGGTINIPQYAKLTLANEARLVVMPGGKITGDGVIEVTNGNEEGFENYNGGTISVGEFNNNFGKFYNNGYFYTTLYAASSNESNFYNHGVAHINNAGNPNWYRSENARIFNACQWYCENDMRAYILELAQGSYFHVGGQLMMSAGNDGSNDPTYVSMANGAFLKAGDLRNNLTSWTGPTDGYAVCEFGKISYLNWQPGTPTTAGYFINNIAVSIDDKTPLNHDNYTPTYDHFRFAVANGYGAGEGLNNYGQEAVGTGNTVIVDKGKADLVVAASEGFELGAAGCTPGYNSTPQQTPENPVDPQDPEDPETPEEPEIEDVQAVWSYAFEDTPMGDYDMNDVVIKVSEDENDSNYLNVTLCCTGASFNLTVYLSYMKSSVRYTNKIFGGTEVHRVLGALPGEFVNTGQGPEKDYYTTRIQKPEGFSFETADFWIDSPACPDGVHVAKAGEDPHGIVIPADWEWPREWVNIKEAYPNFVEFAKDASTTDETVRGWYKKTADNPVSGTTYSR